MSVAEICVLIKTIITAIVGVVPAVVLIVKLVKNRQWDTIKEIADSSMKFVEAYAKDHPGMSSDEKLDMAVELISTECGKLTGVRWSASLVDNIKKYIKSSINWFNDMKK